MSRAALVTPLFDAKAIAARVEALAGEMAVELPKDVLVVSLLKGSFMFTADLVRAMHKHGLHPQIDFMGLSSYGNRTTSSRKVTITQDLSGEVAGHDVLIVDDILESGRTLAYARNLITSRGAKSVHLAVLLEKPGKLEVNSMAAHYVGFQIPDQFVVGYGLDYASQYRELPFIGVLTQH
jgi:hypoxanthine phosphoribosyltransferase